MSTLIQPTDACILAIESSCDETSAAVYCHAQSLLVQETHSQVDMHAEYGGVVPELASRSHLEKLYTVIEAALAKAQKSLSSVDAIAYTRGPWFGWTFVDWC